jgi:hypothetical protein
MKIGKMYTTLDYLKRGFNFPADALLKNISFNENAEIEISFYTNEVGKYYNENLSMVERVLLEYKKESNIINLSELRSSNLKNVKEIRGNKNTLCEIEELAGFVINYDEIKNNPNMIGKFKGTPAILDNSFPDGYYFIVKDTSNFYEEIIKNLKIEAIKLNEKLSIVRNCTDKDNYNTYIAVLKSLRDTLDLISRYERNTNNNN